MKLLPLLSIICLSLLLPSQANAQQFYGGLIGGLNFADISIEDEAGVTENVEIRNLFGVGGILGIKVNENISLEVQPMFLQKGGRVNQTGGNPDFDIKMDFIEVPLLMKAYFAAEALHPYVIVGPTFGFLLNAEMEGENQGIAFSGDLNDISRDLDVGLEVGAGFQFPLGNLSGFVDGRYSFGLINLNKGGEIEVKSSNLTDIEKIHEDAKYSCHGLQIMGGFYIAF